MRFALRWLVIAAMTFGGFAHAAAPQHQYVLFKTSLGDLLFVFDASLAPKTVSQLTELVRGGVYDSTYFYRLEKNFVLQLANAQDRRLPISPSQLALIRKIPLEISSFRHRRGVLSMARFEDPNSAETSFSILLGDAPHLDGQYTTFGFLYRGEETLRAIEGVPVEGNRPRTRVEILEAKLIPPSTAASIPLRGPEVSASTTETKTISGENRVGPERWAVLALLALLGVFSFLLRNALSPSRLGSLGLVIALVAFFGLWLESMGSVRGTSWASIALFASLIGLFRLLSQFEGPA